MIRFFDRYKISVIIPCYNQGKYVNMAVDSILKQTYKNFEIIIVNDGSIDEYTNNLLKNYKKPHTTVYHIKNCGLAEARNYGFSKSNGQFIQFLDADDFITPDKFKKNIDSFKKNPEIDVSYTGYRYYQDDSKEYVDVKMSVLLGNNPYKDFLYKWQRGLSIPIHCALFRRSIWDGERPFIGGFKAVEDWIMWISIARKKSKFIYIDSDCAIYRLHGKNMTKNKSFMMYWATRAISYIADNLIDDGEAENFNTESEKYIDKLIHVFYLT